MEMERLVTRGKVILMEVEEKVSVIGKGK